MPDNGNWHSDASRSSRQSGTNQRVCITSPYHLRTDAQGEWLKAERNVYLTTRVTLGNVAFLQTISSPHCREGWLSPHQTPALTPVQVGFGGTARVKTAVSLKIKERQMIDMYTLYRKPDNGPRQLVGYYDDVMEGAAAIEVDKEKFDDNTQYELEKDEEKDD